MTDTGSLDHRSFLAEIDPETRADLTARSDWPALIRLAFLTTAIVALSTIIFLRLPFWGLAIPALGILWAFLFTLQHECTHKTPFRSTAVNEWVGHAAFSTNYVRGLGVEPEASGH